MVCIFLHVDDVIKPLAVAKLVNGESSALPRTSQFHKHSAMNILTKARSGIWYALKKELELFMNA
ncbi:hypothetical protein T11_3058 [Trichinella zimbabwensis]|uniref:Uncharacterized protein n=1 Tax=Trichinella zimbabwensis TaxID=268475 RepID=A0A0V1HAD4_9BILA|nr:hypothetical protein T11_3058 [Trichinella zimbabwensis]